MFLYFINSPPLTLYKCHPNTVTVLATKTVVLTVDLTVTIPVSVMVPSITVSVVTGVNTKERTVVTVVVNKVVVACKTTDACSTVVVDGTVTSCVLTEDSVTVPVVKVVMTGKSVDTHHTPARSVQSRWLTRSWLRTRSEKLYNTYWHSATEPFRERTHAGCGYEQDRAMLVTAS